MNTQSRRLGSAGARLISATYQVAGMTCGHCERAVITELGKVAGVTGVRVDLTAGSVTVFSDRPVERAAIAGAFDEAGYTLL
ncbi:heavy-metal-associated domain-containing protein [Arthrobacter sp. GCM10027362]|uniref:heavy-metal-associated domain-containing protein n=1 Tax=Arthrobacter sp. GCM10027362 TaxID=3273379 RepID=UPI003640DBB1